MSQIAGCKGIAYSSPTLASAISNLTPAFTFTLAVIFRMEQVRLRSSATQAKIIGAILSISGALVVVLYKGPQVLASASFTTVLPTVTLHQQLTSIESSWIIGGLLLASQYFLISVWYILQVQTLENFTKKDFGFTH
jgi:drug/metabolite transporter (DMT)-like permease